MKSTTKTTLLILSSIIINGAIIAYWYYLSHKDYGGFTIYPPLPALGNGEDGYLVFIEKIQEDHHRFMAALCATGVANIALVAAALVKLRR
ncbi:hypothetical protein CJD36_009310 [Flavipsychrobacter stenotrophus]|uniref:Uncharacterized protein n=1 Tax=Flavipsychrobacter stenotrophus TaxID=2077091 RepID=A0A2S7SZ53_9BACT|nr:hypothetical protein [Flavipsychrobacter stenotrophus]PQJ11978.1 hypothetical protein CJD36_009310 [Flavipsychrobacter stenotrophus]